MVEAIFQFEFLRNTFIVGIIIGFIAPLIGSFIVVKRLSLIADALSHVTLSGIAASLFLSKKTLLFAGINPLYMGIGFSVVGSVMIERLRRVYKHYEELAIPIILSSGMGIGVIFISLADGFNTELTNYLFGSVSAVSRIDVVIISIIALIVVGTITLLFKELFIIAFDEEHATASGIPAKAIHFLFMVLVALVISASIRIVGILLVSSLMTLPVAASMRIANGFKQTIMYSILFGEISIIGGLISAYYLDIQPGGTIVVISILILLSTVGIQKLQLKRGENK